MGTLNVVEFYSGFGVVSDAFKARGHNVYRVEVNPRFDADHRDILTFDPSMLPWTPDGLWFSPPCTSFSMMSVGTHWTMDGQPKTPTAEMGKRLVLRCRELVEQIRPRWFVIENPRARLRSLPFLAGLERRTVSYCQYGEQRMKPTDLWGGFPKALDLKPLCKNGAPCHIAAPRGSRTGTQGMDRAESAKVPLALALALVEAAECDWDVE